ncbi:MAG: Na+/H+ antiporter NhaC family protein [Planctomycetes bacterium]|nr:Na+/H+ antiporter NhaC family protein [Planctomycetota bacterium]
MASLRDLGVGGVDSPRRWGLARPFGALSVVVLVGVVALACGQDTAPKTGPTTSETTVLPPTTPVDAPKSPDEKYGAWVLLPPLLTIVLAIALRQVIPALAVGVLIAAYMLVPCLSPGEAYGGGVVGGLRLAVEEYLLGALASVDSKTGEIKYDHLKIIVFTFLIGGMVGVVAANGGTRAAVERVARWASSRERGQLATWFAGLIVFFDDYANAMIVGPAMRPMTDRLRISRAKLAYIVDSTAAPVASIALIGTWVGAELSYIQDGLDAVTATGTVPTFLGGVTAYGAFLWSLPYRFYAILAIVMVLIVGLLGRDFGPMRKAESAAPPPSDLTEPGGAGSQTPPVGRAWYAVVPVLLLVLATMVLLAVTGWPAGGLASVETAPDMPRWLGLAVAVLRNANAQNSILYGALSALVVAVVISMATRALTLAKSMEAATDVMSRMLPTVIILVLAWTLSAAMSDLRLGVVAVGLLSEHGFDAVWLPLLIFVSSCIVSFATGTSYGTMGILCPATVTISAGLLADMPVDQAMPIFYAAVGAVLAGSVFGDHCSPISDTTVLSSLASSCPLETHVWTQIPYALTVAVVSMLSGEVLCRYFSLPPWVGLLTGSVLLLLIVLAVGRKPDRAEG